MSKEQFSKIFIVKNGTKYEITETGLLLKNGKEDELLNVDFINGTYMFCDGNNIICPLKEMGWSSNSYPYEVIGGYDKTLPNGNIAKTIRVIYRKKTGMVCVDNTTEYKSDGVTEARKDNFTSRPAPFEKI